MNECPNCHNIEQTTKHYCSKCGTKLNDICPFCERAFEVPIKPQPNKIDTLFTKFIKISLISVIIISILWYVFQNTNIAIGNPLEYLASITNNIDQTLSNTLGFTNNKPSTPSTTDKEKINNKDELLANPQNLNILSVKNTEINGIKLNLVLMIFKQPTQNKAQIVLDVRSKINDFDLSAINDMYVIYLFDSKIDISTNDIEINHLESLPQLLAKFIYIKDIANNTIIDEKEYDLINNNLFLKWIK